MMAGGAARTDLGDICSAVALAVVFAAWGLVRWAGPNWHGKRRDFKRWEKEFPDKPEEKQ